MVVLNHRIVEFFFGNGYALSREGCVHGVVRRLMEVP